MELGILVLRASVALAAALGLAFWCRHKSAALRHFVLAAGVVTAVVTLPLARVMPAWEVVPPAAPEAAATPAVLVGGDVAPELEIQTRAQAPRGERPGLLTALAAAWAIAAIVLAAPLVAGLIALRRLTARAPRVDDARWLRLRDDVAASLGVARPVLLLQGGAAVGTWGLVRPRIALPSDAFGWDDDRARAVLAHVQRGDWAVQLVAEALRAVFWFNPLAWIVARRLRDEGERACDDVVLHTGMPDAAYAAHLLDIARAGRGSTPAAAMAMARPSTLEGRIVAMLNPAIDRRVPSLLVRLAAVGLLLVAASAGAVRLVAQQAGPLPLQGAVYDSSGGVLPAVEMALVNEQGVRWTTPTDGEGRFEFTPVGAGKYVLEASIPGFRTLHQDIALERAKDWNKIITLQVGELQETIAVTARRPQKVVPPPAAVNGTGRVRVGGNIKQPRKVANANPIYPEAMRAAGLEGVVKLDVLIATDGTVASVRVLSSEVHPDFAAAASDAVEKWKFTPTLLNGVAVEVAMTVSIHFSLDD